MRRSRPMSDTDIRNFVLGKLKGLASRAMEVHNDAHKPMPYQKPNQRTYEAEQAIIQGFRGAGNKIQQLRDFGPPDDSFMAPESFQPGVEARMLRGGSGGYRLTPQELEELSGGKTRVPQRSSQAQVQQLRPVPEDAPVEAQSFVDFVQEMEGSSGLDKETGLMFPVQSVEDKLGVGRKPTFDIGHGHKLTAIERANQEVYGIDISKGISPAQARSILERDIVERGYKPAESIVDKLHGKGTWDSLSQYQKDMLADMEITGVLKDFPEFRKAVIAKDLEKARKEYKRYTGPKGKKVPLARNKHFAKRFLGL
jgi:hypothetical protein